MYVAHPNEVPPKHVLQWCQTLVDKCCQNGVWGIPRSQIFFRVDKDNKTLVLIVGTKTEPDFIATKRVFQHIGWRVVTEQEFVTESN